ncbi:Intracellular endo-alpha-(1-_5)-L-arabinanase [Planctomycetes bacterium CA13]|uniref:Intracellular endo-alpha-(1->5)-L-arabinanase n=1 Tax=Novipirellula herctigrandis TaxID=2527986 RepID=A0A5C5ZCU2_9BACT|nr:Intracellular endo-alpha-(1->5)-L-arabinanase [Planctomycetes bacterium CA13]
MIGSNIPTLALIATLCWFSPLVTAADSNAILAGGADPAIVAADTAQGEKGYYVASTGRGLNLWYSPDLQTWKRIGHVFKEAVPAWAKAEVPKSSGIWAPDLSYHDGLFYLYYSVSSFGSQRSAIGLAVNKAIDPKDSDYQWINRGKVVESHIGRGDYNAIDPALFVDENGKWYLFFGSFWSGIKAIELDPATGKPLAEAPLIPVASRPDHPTHAIEGAYVIRRGEHYYMFVSWDRCCDGADSDYKVVVGRSENVLGPYVDAQGKPMLDGGGTKVLVGDDRWRGPGHNSILTTDQGQWMAHHTYDMEHLDAQRILQIRPMTWTADGWPKIGSPVSN